MTRKFRPTYWQLESSSMQYIQHCAVTDEIAVGTKPLLKICVEPCPKDCYCFTSIRNK